MPDGQEVALLDSLRAQQVAQCSMALVIRKERVADEEAGPARHGNKHNSI
jgi:hypothetical protein